MNKNIHFVILLLLAALQLSAQVNVSLYSQFHRGDIRYSGSWIYNAPDGSEYALLGTRTGVAAYPMDYPDIRELGFVPGPESNWREVTVVKDHAYVVTEGTGPGQGMQVIDLTFLPDSLHLVTTYSATFNKGHIIQRDIYSEAPYVYVNGNCGSCGINILDVSNPAEPVEVGYYNPGYYIHDCMVKGDRIYAAAFYEAQVDVVDISDKTNPTLITTIADPAANTHSTWVTEDDRFLVICDEQDGLPMRIMNIKDLENPFPVATYSASNQSLTHNPYVRGGFLFVAHNALGLRIVDIADPTLPVEVGYYDTYLTGGDSGSHGLWSANPFSNSGKIIGGNREDGLYVWEFNNTKAGRFYGVVKDSLTGEILTDAFVELTPGEMFLNIDAISGEFKFGDLASNDLKLKASAIGYISKSISFDLLEGDSLRFEIELVQEFFVGLTEKEKQVPILTIFPNPSTNYISVDLSNFPSANELLLYDLYGKVVYSNTDLEARLLELPLDGFAVGLYYLQVLGNEGELLGVGRIVRQ